MKLQVIVGSVRKGRVSNRVGEWVRNEAAKLDGVQAELIDLEDYVLPLFDEAVSPQYNSERQPEGVVKQWLDRLAEADAYVIVTPEYNRSLPGALKNALDYLAYEIEKKPVGLVAHGSTGGAQSVAHLRGIIPGSLGITVPRATYFSDRAAEHISEDGQLSEELQNKPYGPLTALQTTLADTVWYANALKAARDQGQAKA